MEAWNPYKTWDRQHLTTIGDLKRMAALFSSDAPVGYASKYPMVGGGDTETTGLHITKDVPFLIIFGWNIPGKDYGRVFTFKPTQRSMDVFFKLAKKLKVFMWWNTKYDLHMMTNAGYRYEHPNLFEGIALARVVVEAKPTRHGGDAMGLKFQATKYVHPDAGASEVKINEVKKKIKAERVKHLTVALRQYDHPTDTTEKYFRLDTGKATTKPYAEANPDNVELRTVPLKWTKKRVEDFIKDILNEPEELPEEFRDLYKDWLEEYYPHYSAKYGSPKDLEPTYEDIYNYDPEAMITYAGDDVISMLEYYKKAVPIAKLREQVRTIKRENKLILPLYRMERIGMKVDRPYLEKSRLAMKEVIKKKRLRVYEIAGKEIKNTLLEKWDIETEKTNKQSLKKIEAKHPGAPKELCSLVRNLRRLEKWYSTYCKRILDISHRDGRYYTQIAQCSAVSGRVGSDGQQFPKERILTEEGEAYEKEHGENTAPDSMEIFFPRRGFVPTDRDRESGYTAIYYLDYSQIELRNQAEYTIRVSGGDVQMCRAYMPFQCRHYKTGMIYDHVNPKFRQAWDLKQEDNKSSVWLLEDGTPWTKTDVHSETTHNALMQLGYECLEKYKHYKPLAETPKRNLVFGSELNEKAFKLARYKGKTFNFMKNYGGGATLAMEVLDLPRVAADALVSGYETSFPEVITYQKWVVKMHNIDGYVENQYGRRYYLDDNRDAYKLANYLIQGTCADMLKEGIIAIDELLLPYKSRFIMNIHDELQFEIWKGEEHLIQKILDIMQTHDWHQVPIVSDVEIAEDTWATKKEVA
jgi:DNA polymerase-1